MRRVNLRGLWREAGPAQLIAWLLTARPRFNGVVVTYGLLSKTTGIARKSRFHNEGRTLWWVELLVESSW